MQLRTLHSFGSTSPLASTLYLCAKRHDQELKPGESREHITLLRILSDWQSLFGPVAILVNDVR